MSEPRSPHVTVSSVSARRGGRMIFMDLSFTAAPGDAVMIAGPNGSGKSTLLRLLTGLGRPESGTIERSPEDENAFRHIGHRDGLKGALTVTENLSFWSSVYGLGQDTVGQAIEHLNLTQVADMPADMLSAGWKRRAALARLALGEAPLWILDEPYTSLDGDNVKRIDELMAKHTGAGGMVIFASHQTPSFPLSQTIDMAVHAAPAEAVEW